MRINGEEMKYRPVIMGHDHLAGAVCWACDREIKFESLYIVRTVLGVGTVLVHWGDCPGGGDVS